MDITLFYTFSTIAQTLAGAIALLGAFVLFRLQSLNAEMKERSATLIECYYAPYHADLEKLLRHGEYQAIFDSTDI